MRKTRKSVSVSLQVTAPAGMPIQAIRREVLTRINDVTGHYCGVDFDLPDSAEGTDGNLKIRASLARPEQDA